jgi:glutaconate CoA-transferase subunit A
MSAGAAPPRKGRGAPASAGRRRPAPPGATRPARRGRDAAAARRPTSGADATPSTAAAAAPHPDDKVIALSDVARYVPSGCTLGVGGGPVMATPTALLREVVRAGVHDLHIVAASTGGFGIDLLIGAGAVASVEFAQIVLNEFGAAPNFRRHAEAGRLRCLDHT